MEHLAGRIAAACALKAVGVKGVPGTGDQRQPLWPAPWSGSISHCDTRALAVVAARPVGIDIENVLTLALAEELESSIISPAERGVLKASGLPFELALTLAFSAKESGFKPASAQQSGTGFMAWITDIQGESSHVDCAADVRCIGWRMSPTSSRFANATPVIKEEPARSGARNAMLAQHIVRRGR
jgi:enterobactin synthetase component D